MRKVDLIYKQSLTVLRLNIKQIEKHLTELMWFITQFNILIS